MSKVPAVLLSSVLVLAGLTACSTAPATSASDCEPVVQGGSTSTAVRVSSDLAEEPDAHFSAPLDGTVTERTVAVAGDGPVVTEDTLPSVTFSIYDGTTGDEVVSTGIDAPTLATALAAQAPVIDDALQCATGGSRLVVTLGGEDAAPLAQAFAGYGVAADSTIVVAIDVHDVLPRVASGSPQAVFASGLPAVVQDAEGTPGINIPSTPAPSTLRVAELIAGDGAPVDTDRPVLVNAMIVLWDDGQIVSSSWQDNTPSLLDVSSIAADDAMGQTFTTMLSDRTAGSRVVAVVPPENGYGAEGAGQIPGGATQIIVLDVLGNLGDGQ